MNMTLPAESMVKLKSLVNRMKHQVPNSNDTFSTNNNTAHENVWSEPNYFRNEVSLERLITRGNILTAHTGCAIATWSYQGKRHTHRPLNECRQHAKSAAALRAHQVMAETASQVQENDTIYGPIVKLEDFVNTTLPGITHDFVLLSGQNSKPPDPIPRHVYDAIMHHPRSPRILKWFLQNLSVYAVDNPHDSKLRPFPYGVHPMQPPALLQELKMHRTKTNYIYKSWFFKSPTTFASDDTFPTDNR